MYSAQYLSASVYESRVFVKPKQSKPVYGNIKTFAGQKFIPLSHGKIGFIEDCLRHKTNTDTVFKPRTYAVYGDKLHGVVELHKDEKFGHKVFVRHDGNYYESIEPVWFSDLEYTEQPFNVGDEVKEGVIGKYIGSGFYEVNVREINILGLHKNDGNSEKTGINLENLLLWCKKNGFAKSQKVKRGSEGDEFGFAVKPYLKGVVGIVGNKLGVAYTLLGKSGTRKFKTESELREFFDDEFASVV